MKPKPAETVIRFAVVNELGEHVTGLHRNRKLLDRLLKEHGDPGERVARFEVKEVK